MRVFDFDHAIVRQPGRSVVNGLRSNPDVVPDFAEIVREHAAYVAALKAAGLKVDILPPLEEYPDSIFVEDPALVLPEGAILLRPGAPTRLGESAEMRGVLHRHFENVFELSGDEHADGGDVLVTAEVIFIGLSRRTNRQGAEAVRATLARLGRKAQIAETPASILHFKTAASLLSQDTALATRRMADSGMFAKFNIVLVPYDEEDAANALRINNLVFVGDHFPGTINAIARAGFDVRPLPVREIGKLDAGLSCMSLRWSKPR